MVKSLTSDLLDVTHPEAQDNKQYVDKRSQELVLSIGKKEFALLHADNTFRYYSRSVSQIESSVNRKPKSALNYIYALFWSSAPR